MGLRHITRQTCTSCDKETTRNQIKTRPNSRKTQILGLGRNGILRTCSNNTKPPAARPNLATGKRGQQDYHRWRSPTNHRHHRHQWKGGLQVFRKRPDRNDGKIVHHQDFVARKSYTVSSCGVIASFHHRNKTGEFSISDLVSQIYYFVFSFLTFMRCKQQDINHHLSYIAPLRFLC